MQKKLKSPAATVIRADEDAYCPQDFRPGHQSSNPEFSVEAATSAYEARQRQREVVALAINALSATRATASPSSTWQPPRRHERRQNQIRAICGEDSDELASMGLKKIGKTLRHPEDEEEGRGDRGISKRLKTPSQRE